MASSDGSSARDILRNVFGRMGDLSAAINQQQGSSLRRDTDLPPASLEDDVRNVFNTHQVRPSKAAVPRMSTDSRAEWFFRMPATKTSASLYTTRRNFMVIMGFTGLRDSHVRVLA